MSIPPPFHCEVFREPQGETPSLLPFSIPHRRISEGPDDEAEGEEALVDVACLRPRQVQR